MVTTSPDAVATPRKTDAKAAVPASVRDPRLDFYRGIAMFIILFAHTPGNFFTSWIPARWGFSDATEVFVFCSGMASAIAFGRTFDRAGWLMGSGRVAYRVWQVYWAHIGMFFFIATMLAAFDHFGGFKTHYIGTLNLWKFFQAPAEPLIGLFTLSYVPNYFDILPMYMVILVMMPFVMALSRINLWLMAAVLATVWLFAQGGLLEMIGREGMSINFPAEPWSQREWFFNPFGWQLIFFTGFAFMRGWIPAPPVKFWLIALALLIVLANIPLSSIGVRAIGRDWFFETEGANWVIEWRKANRPLISKSDFGILRYVHFLALAYLGWVAAGLGGRRLIAAGTTLASRAWGGFVGIIMKVGQQSLAVFVFSMVFARFTGFVLDQIERSTAKTTMMNLVGVAALIGVAYFVAWIKSQPWRVKKPV